MDQKQDIQRRKPSFDVDTRITISIHQELAIQLSSLILSTDTKNPALLAIAHQLTRQCLNSDSK